MHFTLWPGLRATEGGHAEITWESFLSFVASPAVAAEKTALEGWSPARFAGNRRSGAAAELVSAIVLDDDATGLPLERVVELWAGVAGVVHSSFSHTAEHPKWRIVLCCSRDMTPDEHARVWATVRAAALARGQKIDESTKDPSRLWFVPARRADGPYEWHELVGDVLDVDEILAKSPATVEAHGLNIAVPDGSKFDPEIEREAQRILREPAPATDRRKAMALALGAAWPAKGRHDAQLALAGALRAEGWPAEEALEFLCDVCRTAGDEDRPKREATIRHTYSRAADAPTTGWTRLKSHVDGVLVDAARAALGLDADWNERTNRRLAELAARAAPTIVRPDTSIVVPGAPPLETVAAGPITFELGGYDADLPPIDYQVDGLIARGDVVMFVAHGNSLKTWLAFSLAASIASGRPWLGRFVTQRGRAGILDFESGRYEVLRRLKLLGVKAAEVGDRLLRASYPAAQLTDPETWIALAEQRFDFLVTDSYNAAAPELDENDARAALMLQHAGRVADAVGMTSVFIHHARKGTGGDRREAVRGSTALFAACDRIFEFTDLEKKDGGIVLSTMRSMKDGAGRAPLDVRVELSDQGLRFVEEVATPKDEDEEKNTPDQNRKLLLEILRSNTAGVPKAILIDVMKGRKDRKYELLASLVIAGLIVEFKSNKRDYVMLKPGAVL